MRKWKQVVATLLTAAIISNNAINSLALSTWTQVEGDWYHIGQSGYDTGWFAESEDVWYYLDNEGKMQTGWIQDSNGLWYYFNEADQGTEGQMKYGWYQDTDGSWYYLNTEHDGSFGAAIRGWAWIDGKCYYFGQDCRMFSNTETPDGYLVDVDGHWVVDGVIQTRLDPGLISQHVHILEQIKRSAASSGSSSSSSSSSSNSSSDSGSSDGTNGSGSDGDDTYRVYEESNKETFETNDNVKTFPNTTAEERQLLQDLADSIVDVWTETDAVETEVAPNGEDQVEFQTVTEICLTITSNSPLMDQITNERLIENDVIYIPSCDAFPSGISFVYLSHDDEYTGDALESYEPDDYEVVHLIEAAMADMFAEEIVYSAGGVNEEQPVQYVWTPVLWGDTVLSRMAFQPENASLVDTLSENALLASNSNAQIQNEESLSSEIFLLPEDPYSLANITNTVKATALSTEATAQSSSGSNHFSLKQSITDSGLNLTLEASKLVLYDVDGDLNTKDDQITLDGSIGLENVNPTFGFHWSPELTDPLPKQLKAVVEYDEVINLGFEVKEQIDLKSFMENMRKALNQPENKQNYLMLELQGVDWNNTLVLACCGVNVGLNQVAFNMKDIQQSTQNVFTGMQPMIVFMVLMDLEGNISVRTSLDMEHRNYNKKGLNVQQEGYTGNLGTQAQNRGDYNTSFLGYDINIYNKNDAETTVKASLDGSAELEAGVGVGAGIMCLGIMPAMVKGTLRTDMYMGANGEVGWSSKEGATWNVQGEAEIRAYLRGQALIKLLAKAKILWMTYETSFEREFNLPDFVIFDISWESPSLGLNDSWKKYLDYTDTELQSEFYSLEVENTHYDSWYNGFDLWENVNKNVTMYFDKEPYEAENMYHFEESNKDGDVVITVTSYSLEDSGEIIRQNRILSTRLRNIITGMTENTTLEDLDTVSDFYFFDSKVLSMNIDFTEIDMYADLIDICEGSDYQSDYYQDNFYIYSPNIFSDLSFEKLSYWNEYRNWDLSGNYTQEGARDYMEEIKASLLKEKLNPDIYLNMYRGQSTQ